MPIHSTVIVNIVHCPLANVSFHPLLISYSITTQNELQRFFSKLLYILSCGVVVVCMYVNIIWGTFGGTMFHVHYYGIGKTEYSDGNIPLEHSSGDCLTMHSVVNENARKR